MNLEYPRFPLEDDNIAIRPWRLDDVGCVEEAATDASIPKGTSVPPVYSLQEAEDFIRRQGSRIEQGVGVSQAIVAKSSNRAVGLIILSDRPEHNGAELGYWIVPKSRKMGIGSAAIKLVSDWGLSALGLERVEAYVGANNVASERSLKRSGFHFEGRLRNYLRFDNQTFDAKVFSRIPTGLS